YASAYYDPTKNDATYYVGRQVGFAGLGLVAMYVVSTLNYQWFRALSLPAVVVSVILLLLVLVMGYGDSQVGAQRWIEIGPISFQPSEIAKVAVILYFATRLSKRDSEPMRRFSKRSGVGRTLNVMEKIGFLELLPYGLVLLAVLIPVLLQPHMSGTILILVGAAAVLFAAGVHLGWFIFGGGAVVTLLWAVINLTNYQSARITIWKDPWSDPTDGGFQIIQSLYAIGSGGLLGLGLGQSRQKYLYVPEPENDFIFPIAVEELGFIGGALIIILFMLLILRGYWLALHARDRFGALTIVGIITLLAAQVFLNIGVVTNTIPTTGISLPFFSYGGTALIIQLVQMGIILSISRQIPASKQD
ncbi:MAG: FtsW/RodA/SpoVE family cell cycle protein, partial [Eubacteriales bacterium]